MRSLGLVFFLIAVFLMPLQLEIAAFKNAAGTRLPPGDVFLALAILAAPASLKFRAIPVAMLPVAMIATLGWGVALAILYAGGVSAHAVNVKFLGAAVLALWCLVTVGYARAGHGPRILRVWLLGMTIWAVVAYVDWKWVDFLGFVTAKTPSRFGGMMHDPNNAGAAYAVAAVLAWKYGHRVFSSRAVHASVVLICVFALSQTFSRTGEIGLVAAVAVVLAIEAVGAARWARYLAVGTVLLVAAIGTGIVSDSSDEWTRRPDNVSSRDEITTVGLDAFADSGGLGIGLGTYRADNDKIIHNTAIWLMVELSFVGALFFFAMCAVPFQAALRMRRSDMDLAIALIGAHAVMMVASNGIEALYQRQWWLVIGLCASSAVPLHAERVR